MCIEIRKIVGLVFPAYLLYYRLVTDIAICKNMGWARDDFTASGAGLADGVRFGTRQQPSGAQTVAIVGR